jgi:type VI secretion system protein VasG
MMEDGEGRFVDFKNTLIILTTNIGTELIMSMCKDPQLMPSAEGIAKALRQALLKAFPAALLGRLVVIPYYPLSDEVLGRIIRLQLERVRARFRDNHDAELSYEQGVVDLIASRCTEPESGGRMIDAILTNTLLPQISQELLARLSSGAPTAAVDISARESAFQCRFR